MQTLSKIFLLGIGGVITASLALAGLAYLTLRGTAWAFNRVVERDPVAVAAAGGEIAEFTPPEGFGGGYTLEVADYRLVSYSTSDGHTHLYVIQAPATLTLTREELEAQGEQAFGAPGWDEMRVVEERPCVIRGKSSTLVISEGVSHDGGRYRSASALFQGNGGLALVNISGPAVTWDEGLVDSFIEGLR